MADHQHLVYGKPAPTGTPIHYIDSNGVRHAATMKNLEPVYHADIEADVEGARRFMQHIPFNEGGMPGSWNHIPDPDPVDTETAEQSLGATDEPSKKPRK